MQPKEPYVVFEVAATSPPIKGKYHVYVTPWASKTSVFEDYLDSLEDGEPASLTVTVHQWSQRELAAFCEEQDVEWEEVA